MKIKGKHIKLFGLIGLILVLIIFLATPKEEEQILTVQGGWDISDQVIGMEDYLKEESDFDYTDEAIFQKAEEIKKSTSTPRAAIEETIKFVARHVRYSSAITIGDCYAETASSVMESRSGDCVSMSRLVTALLRAQGIPARTAGGCLSSSIRCAPMFAVIPGEEAKTVVMTEGDFKKRGFLHEWVEAYDPVVSEWILIEATSGQAFETGCNTYLQYSYDSNNRNRCVIRSDTFWKTCLTY